MDLKQKLIDMSREATGDAEITVAGDFQPKGLTWKRAASTGAGAFLGGGAGDIGEGVGAAAGYVAGTYAATSGKLPPVIVAAASPSKLYLLTPSNAKGIVMAQALALIDTLDRANLTFEMKQKLTTRTVVITDESTGHTYAMEGKRVFIHHMNDLLDALAEDAGGDDDEDDDEAATESSPEDAS